MHGGGCWSSWLPTLFAYSYIPLQPHLASVSKPEAHVTSEGYYVIITINIHVNRMLYN
jgi:hypothetical protein